MDQSRDIKIISAAKRIRDEHWNKSSNVSFATKSSNKIHKEWQRAIKSEFPQIEIECKVANIANEKIDVVDVENKIAYELKVSGNNISHEFYKNLCKVITYNCHQNKNSMIKEFVFMSDAEKIKSFSRRLDKKFVKSIKSNYSIEIRLKGL
ncbi:hypothetical protein FRY97_21900 [Phaeodactylibacter luteus]|uniref:Uncharacterized protein n=2 Tax=Phaeodactylibacter luteus TaxID=1564516 RepID=A0A5C6REQ9_9BACT|nr:hypothetical protein FRY97_21900 [Phaeodactylibacter luteus]